MFLVSGPELVTACCRSGILGTFPALNVRTTSELDAWLGQIQEALAAVPEAAPFGVNLIVHRSNRRLDQDLALVVRHRVPVVITSLGAVPDLVQEIHAYGGLVFHDVATPRHVEKAAEAGVDAVVLVCGGAGGHAGTLNPFAFLADRISGIPGSFLKPSLVRAGLDPARLHERPPGDIEAELARGELRAWRDIWSAGQGVAAITDIPPVAALVDRLEAEYRCARDELCGDAA